MPRNGRPKVFSWPNSSSRALFCPPRTSLKHLFYAQNSFQSLNRPALSICFNIPPLNLFYFPSFTSLAFQIFKITLKSKSPFISNQSTMASSRTGSKRKGKAPMQEDSPPHYDHSGYLSRESFNRFSTRNINFGRIPNFSSLDFMNFNQIMRRLKWQSFARLNNPSYPSLIRRFMVIWPNLVRVVYTL